MNMTKDYNVSPPPERPLRRDVPHTHAQYPHQIEEILPEERELFRSCIYGMVLKSGVPFAVIMHCFSKYAENSSFKQIIPKNVFTRTFAFLGNIFIGSLIFSPICVQRLRVFHEENKKRRLEMLNPSFPAVEGVSVSSTSEDFSYPSDLISSLNEPEGSYSFDFTPTSLLGNEEEKKLLSTTYEDLRTQNRSGKSQADRKPPSRLNIERPGEPDPLSAPITSSAFDELPPPSSSSQPPPPPRKATKKNKYGDEME